MAVWLRVVLGLLALGVVFTVLMCWFVGHTKEPPSGEDGSG